MPPTQISLYSILEIPPTATENQIKKSYHNLAKKYHPDKLPNDSTEKQKQTATEKFRILNQAYEILIDSKSRCLYDNEEKNRVDLEKKRREYEERRRFEQELLEKQAKIDAEKIKKYNQKVKVAMQAREQERYVNDLMARREKAKIIRNRDELHKNFHKNSTQNTNIGNIRADAFLDFTRPAHSFMDFTSLVEENLRRNPNLLSSSSNKRNFRHEASFGTSNIERFADELFEEFFRD